ncbi:HNH endonuclease [Halorubrum ezzemoulense]|uniref:HNH endonuclease n=1 Tax=Halorubrum ezzemoulense TaxID=337243 RepID=UPI00232DCD11|nr:HNH endonuclease [Halorubrum ezzemoulense]MDB9247469.1 HNH endonuclease [Halorubrum ezzemoulense]MDB9258622.1 HNH endonuclease [Halorubrum ezzemoulense]MDB9264520.1 HNH endonuclease [Halorubrum ezzemoulense]MDB9268983.1 HNH endonuclease [Halorubrum ezzemoulense]MDB9271488.1 HNH endonuclease [Halorubrum ezzemoulense]
MGQRDSPTDRRHNRENTGGARDYPSDWAKRRKRVYRRDNYTCQNDDCGRQGGPHGDAELHAHHIVPRSEGGSDALANLVTLCYRCHNEVHDHHIPRQTDSGAVSADEAARDNSYSFSTDSPTAIRTAYVNGEIDEDEMERLLDDAIDDAARDPSPSARDPSTSTDDGASSRLRDVSPQRGAAYVGIAVLTAIGATEVATAFSGALAVVLLLVAAVAALFVVGMGTLFLDHTVSRLRSPRA